MSICQKGSRNYKRKTVEFNDEGECIKCSYNRPVEPRLKSDKIEHIKSQKAPKIIIFSTTHLSYNRNYTPDKSIQQNKNQD